MVQTLQHEFRRRPNAYTDAEPQRMRAYALRVAESGERRLAQILLDTADEIERYRAAGAGIARGSA